MKPARSGWGWVAGALLASSLLSWFIDRHVSLTIQAMLYLAGVVAVAYRCTRTQSAVTAVLSVLALNLLFVPPRGSLSVDSIEHIVTLATLLVVAFLVSTLAANLRRETALARLGEQRAQRLQNLAGELSVLDDEAQILPLAADRLREAYGPQALLVLPRPDGTLPSVPDAAMADALKHCISESRALGPGTLYWPDLPTWYLPLRAGAHTLGAAALPSGESDPAALHHAEAVCALLAGAIQRARHVAQVLAARGQAEAQGVRNALLASVSHDYRTPLASIVGSVSSLIEQRDRLSEADRAGLLARIDQEAKHLVTMTENTLQWARLANDQQALKLDWESMEEVIGSVRARMRQRDPTRRVRAEVPTGLPLVRADPVLLGQLLENLVDNALKYSDGPVDIQARQEGAAVSVSVKDRGPGLSDDELATVFDSFTRGAAAQGVRGVGLGLAVCRAIAQTHGATLQAHRRRGGGSSFVLTLPVHEPPPMGEP
jgi:two-component system, OmpR family, sensor histidine kinase KdpD